MSVLTFATRHAAARLLPSQYYRQHADADGICHSRGIQGVVIPVCLTFDDGPHPEHTPRVLDQLAELNAKATFFMIGDQVRRHPAIVRQVLAAGHSVGSHTQTHCRASQMSAARYVHDAVLGRQQLEQTAGVACPCFRPPFGELTPLSLLGLLRLGMRIVRWSHDPKDFDCSDCESVREWFCSHQPSPGAILLLHDDREITSRYLSDFLRPWSDMVKYCNVIPANDGDFKSGEQQ